MEIEKHNRGKEKLCPPKMFNLIAFRRMLQELNHTGSFNFIIKAVL